jgi:hypothetical protein
MAFFKSESFCALSLPTGSRKSPGVFLHYARRRAFLVFSVEAKW